MTRPRLYRGLVHAGSQVGLNPGPCRHRTSSSDYPSCSWDSGSRPISCRPDQGSSHQHNPAVAGVGSHSRDFHSNRPGRVPEDSPPVLDDIVVRNYSVEYRTPPGQVLARHNRGRADNRNPAGERSHGVAADRRCIRPVLPAGSHHSQVRAAGHTEHRQIRRPSLELHWPVRRGRNRVRILDSPLRDHLQTRRRIPIPAARHRVPGHSSPLRSQGCSPGALHRRQRPMSGQPAAERNRPLQSLVSFSS